MAMLLVFGPPLAARAFIALAAPSDAACSFSSLAFSNFLPLCKARPVWNRTRRSPGVAFNAWRQAGMAVSGLISSPLPTAGKSLGKSRSAGFPANRSHFVGTAGGGNFAEAPLEEETMTKAKRSANAVSPNEGQWLAAHFHIAVALLSNWSLSFDVAASGSPVQTAAVS